ncbi:MAG TPA: MFS transporter [Candidatus Nanoarchaeia archaeon]|nr:MFS transporter [Candidatus Nanoarchaeia archaeon]
MRLFSFMPRVSSRVGRFGSIVFIRSIALALISSVIAIYMSSFLHNDSLVGFAFVFLVIVSIITHFLIIPIIETKSKKTIFIFSCFMIGIGYLLYAVIHNFWLFLLVAVMITIFTALKLAAGGLIIEHISNKKNLSKNEGLMYTFLNLGWVIGPLIAGFILKERDNLNYIFILAAVLIIIAGILLWFFNIDGSAKKGKIDLSVIKNFKDFFNNKNRVKTYFLGAGINFWWSLIFVYMPLLIIKTLSDSYVGFFLFFVIIPLLLLEYHFGYLAGKKGYKKIFVVGNLIAAICALLCFIYFGNIWLIMAIVVVASVGLAMIEGTTESYFFDTLKRGEDQRFYAPYNTAVDIGNLIGEFFPALILLLLPFRFIFLFYALGMLALAVISSTLKEVVESRRRAEGFK